MPPSLDGVGRRGIGRYVLEHRVRIPMRLQPGLRVLPVGGEIDEFGTSPARSKTWTEPGAGREITTNFEPQSTEKLLWTRRTMTPPLP